MSGPLVDQLVEAGLVTVDQARASELQDQLVSIRRVIQNLVGNGLDERILAGFFVAKGFGPMLQAAELSRADLDLVRRLAPADAHDLCAMPLRPSGAGAVVAMADPTDEHAIAKLALALGGRVLPIVAKLSDLLAAIDRVYPPDRPTLLSDPVAAARSRAPSGVVPLVQEKPAGGDQTLDDMEPPKNDFASTASPVWDQAWSRSSTEREVSLTPQASYIPVPTHPPPAQPESNIDAELAELRAVATRDAAVQVACNACLRDARGAAFLALRKGVFRGGDGAGDDVTSAGIRSLWVPASDPSILNEVLHSGKPFRGPYGQTAEDLLLRAAFGRQGLDVVIVQVLIGARMVGVVCA